MTFISMPQSNTSNMASTQFKFTNIHFEPKANNHKVIDCAINMASITFESCVDLSSIQNTNGYTYNLRRYTGTTSGGVGIQPTIRYVNCHLAGYDLYEGPTTTRGRFIYDGCYFYRGGPATTINQTPAQGTNPVLSWSSGTPRYTFRDCWNAGNLSN